MAAKRITKRFTSKELISPDKGETFIEVTGTEAQIKKWEAKRRERLARERGEG